MWQRHHGDSAYHFGALTPDGHSFLTLCSGRWPSTDLAAGLVEQHDDPPVAERCSCCAKRASTPAESEWL